MTKKDCPNRVTYTLVGKSASVLQKENVNIFKHLRLTCRFGFSLTLQECEVSVDIAVSSVRV